MTIENLAFCLTIYLTDVHFRDELQHAGHAGQQKIEFRPIRTREIAGVRLIKRNYMIVLKLFRFEQLRV